MAIRCGCRGSRCIAGMWAMSRSVCGTTASARLGKWSRTRRIGVRWERPLYSGWAGCLDKEPGSDRYELRVPYQCVGKDPAD